MPWAPPPAASGCAAATWPWSATTRSWRCSGPPGGALAIAVGTGVGTAGAFARLPDGRGPHLFLPGVSELLEMCAGHGKGT